MDGEISDTTLIAAAAFVVFALLAVLARLLLQLHARGRARRSTDDALARHNQDSHDQRLKSLEMITLATLAGDCELSEGCLRVRALLRDYPGLRTAPEFAPIEALHEEIRDLAVGEARRRLSAAELARQDERRRAIEGRHRGAVLGSFRILRERARSMAGSRFDVAVATGAARTESTPP